MASVETPSWSVVTDIAADLGEVPIFDERSGCLYWLDVFERALHRTTWSSGETRTWRFTETVGSYALYEDGRRALLALHSGLAVLHFESSVVTPLVAAPYDQEHERFNDGRCDSRGNFWVGTIRLPGSDKPDGSGHFYKYSQDTLTRVVDGVTVANGIAFSPDDRTMYLADRVNARILSYSFDAVAAVASTPEVFTELDPSSIPDGAAVDVDGGYWIAMFGEGEVRRYTPDGRLDRTLVLPVTQPTMCAFAGPGLETLVVTTARWRLDPEELSRQPDAGRVLATQIGATGRPEPRYREAR